MSTAMTDKQVVYNEHDRPLSVDDTEKSGGFHDEHLSRDRSHEDSTDPRITQFSLPQQRKIMHRIDRRLVLTLGAMYRISLMDRTNLSAANIAG